MRVMCRPAKLPCARPLMAGTQRAQFCDSLHQFLAWRPSLFQRPDALCDLSLRIGLLLPQPPPLCFELALDLLLPLTPASALA